MNLFWSGGILIGFVTNSLASVESIDYNGPKRVLLPKFSIVIIPAPENLSILAAQEIRDVAENLFQENLSEFPWEVSTIYEYAGLSTVRDILVNNDQNPPNTVIQIQGGVVVFAADSTEIPSEIDVISMLRDSLYPVDKNQTSLTEQLNTLEEFGQIQHTEFKVQQSIFPSFAPTAFIDHGSNFPSSIFDELSSIPTNQVSLLEPTYYPSLLTTPMPTIYLSDSPIPSSIPSTLMIEPIVQSYSTKRPSFNNEHFLSMFPTFMPSQQPLISEQPSLGIKISETPSLVDDESPSLFISLHSTTPSPSSQYFTPSTIPPTTTPSSFQTKTRTVTFSKSPTKFSITTMQPSFEPKPAGKTHMATALPTNDPWTLKSNIPSSKSSVWPTENMRNEVQTSLEPIITKIPTQYKSNFIDTSKPVSLDIGDSISKQTESLFPSIAPPIENDLPTHNNSTTLNSNLVSSSPKIVLVSCTLIGSIFLSSLYALIIFRRRNQRKKNSNVDMKDSMSYDLEEDALHRRDHLRQHRDEKSDGSSTFRQLFQRTGSEIQHEAKGFPIIQNSSQSIEIFIPRGKMNSEGTQRQNTYPGCMSQSQEEQMMLQQSSLQVATFPYPVDLIDLTSDIKFNNWADSSQSDGNDFTKTEDSDIDVIFPNDNLWDFEDNCDDDEHTNTNPFSNVGSHNRSDKLLLLGEFYLRSSSASWT
jgi:hypothetical protein